MWTIILFFIFHWYASLFMQSFFLHRYCAHRMYTMSPFWEKFFYWLTFILQGSSYLNPRAYAYMHGEHHLYSDTEKDPHSPHFFKTMWAMMKATGIYYQQLVESQELRHHKNQVTYPLLDKITGTWWSRILWALAYTLFYIYYAPSWHWFALLPLHFFMGPIHGAIVNWFGHKYGYRNHELQDQSVNTLPLDLLLMGELYQNNHHYNGKKPSFTSRWWEVDPTYLIMLGFHYFGIIELKSKFNLKKIIPQIEQANAQELEELGLAYHKDQSLARKLWKTQTSKVQNFALKIVDLKKLSKRQLAGWASLSRNQEMTKAFTSHVANQVSIRQELVRQWIYTKKTNVQKCGYALTSELLSRGESLSQKELGLILDTIGKRVNSVGQDLREQMLQTAKLIGSLGQEWSQRMNALIPELTTA